MNGRDIIFCPRCGEKMHRNQRNCLKCGQLNYENPDNEYMKKYETNNSSLNNTYVIGQGTFNFSNGVTSGYRPNEILAYNTGNLTGCVIFNILFYLFGLLGIYVLFIIFGVSNILFNNTFLFTVMGYSIVFILIYSQELLFMKADKPWWGALIPFYSQYLMFEIVFGKGYLFLLTFIPIVGQIMMLILFYRLGKVFNKNSILTLIFNVFSIPFISFSSTTSYNGVIYVSRSKGQDSLGYLYKCNKNILIFMFSFILAVLSLFIYNERNIVIDKAMHIMTISFTKDAKTIIKDAKSSIKDNYYVCSNGKSITNQNDYYIWFDNAGDYFGSKSVSVSILSNDYYKGYIHVKVFDNKEQYYISVSDGKYGIEEVDNSKLSSVHAVKGYTVSLPENVIICHKEY